MIIAYSTGDNEYYWDIPDSHAAALRSMKVDDVPDYLIEHGDQVSIMSQDEVDFYLGPVDQMDGNDIIDFAQFLDGVMK